MRHPERERRRAELLERLHPELSETLRFLKALADAADDLAPDRGSGTVGGAVDPAAGDRAGREGATERPPVDPYDFALDEPAAARAFRTVTDALVQATGSEEAVRVAAAVEAGRLDPVPLARAYLTADDDAFAVGAEIVGPEGPELLRSLAELAVKPQFIARARSEGDAALADRSDRCPTCGSFPELVVIADRPEAEAIALGVCRLCETEWPVHRARCPGCGNEDRETLGYLQAEDEDGARVSVCDRCRRYVPVLDARGRLEIAPAVDRATLVHLDLLAQQRGYRPLNDAATDDGGTAEAERPGAGDDDEATDT